MINQQSTETRMKNKNKINVNFRIKKMKGNKLSKEEKNGKDE